MTLPFEGSLAYRHRNFWEAADAGLLLWRENFAYFLPFFAVPFWTAAFALRIIPQELRYLSWLLLWLLRPLFDRAVLHVISIRYFEDDAGTGRLLRGLFASLSCGLAGDLLWRRFSPFRFVMMPLRVLEKPERRKLRERRQTLNKGGLGLGVLLTFWGVALEAILFCGELLFFFIMHRLFKDGLLAAFDISAMNTELWYFVLWCANFMLVETICVCMGFSVYLNSRVEVEGWDLEILLRRLCEKRERKNFASSGWIALVLLCLGLCMLCPAEGFAEERPLPFSSANVPEKALESVFASPDFGGEKETWGIRLKKQKEPGKVSDYNPPAWIKNVLQTAAFMLRAFVILGIAAVAVFLLWYLRRFLPERKFKKSKVAMHRLVTAAAESPESLLQKAACAFEQGELRLAWGFCAAAALRLWSLYRGTNFPPGATEYECVALVKAATISANAVNGAETYSAEAEAFSVLIENWVKLAYGGQLPPAGSFETSLAFCKSFGFYPGESRGGADA